MAEPSPAKFLLFLKANQPLALAKAAINFCPAPFPPQAGTVDQDHGRIETRELWCVATDPQAISAS